MSLLRNRRSYPPRLFGVIIVVGVGIFLAYLANVVLPTHAKSRIQAMLEGAGFPAASVGAVEINTSGLTAKDIKLDEYGFDKISVLKARFNWLPFLLGGDVSQIAVDGINIGRDAVNLESTMRQMGENLLKLPSYRIDISNAVLDLGTAYGEIRIEGQMSVSPSSDKEPRKLNALIRSNQYQLGFESDWQGTISPNGAIDIAGKVDSGRLNVGPMRISRFNGWVALASGTDGFTGQAQMEAGSATFMDMPLEGLSLVVDRDKDRGNILFRSGVSGMRDVRFAADYTKAGDTMTFTSVLNGENLGSFLDYVEEATGHDKTIRDALLTTKPFELRCDFQPDRGFVGGPLPFSIALSQEDKMSVSGNVLLYTDTLEVRGALEGEPEMTLALQEYFKIPPENVNGNYIRLEGGAQRFFMFDDKSSDAGAEDVPADDSLSGTGLTPAIPHNNAPAALIETSPLTRQEL